jgi:hypothetical protein
MQAQENAPIRTQAPKRLFTVSNRTREGRFLKHCETQLVSQLGGDPSFAQLVLVRRAARAMLQLEKMDAQMARGEWSDHAARTYGGLGNSLRLNLRELGLDRTKGKRAPPAPSPSDLKAYVAGRRSAPAAEAAE